MRAVTLRRLLELPELMLVVFALLLHFPWEMLQAVLYEGVRDGRYVDVLRVCGSATLGDAAIVLAAFWTVAWRDASGRQWLLSPAGSHFARFTLVGVLITVVIELLATKVWNRWSYGELMPVVPLLDVGLGPLLQWAILSPLIAWFVHRQLR